MQLKLYQKANKSSALYFSKDFQKGLNLSDAKDAPILNLSKIDKSGNFRTEVGESSWYILSLTKLEVLGRGDKTL